MNPVKMTVQKDSGTRSLSRLMMDASFRSRAAAENIIPTTAEAAKAVGRVIPELRGKLTGSAVRVPVPAGCLITLTSVVSGENLTADSLNDAMKQARSEIFGYAEDEYVSSDIVGNTYASISIPPRPSYFLWATDFSRSVQPPGSTTKIPLPVRWCG